MEEELERIQDIQAILDPSIVDVAVQIVQLNAITSVAIVVVFFALGWTSFSVMRSAFHNTDWNSETPGKHGIIFTFSAWGFLGSAVIILIQIFDTWTWMAFLNPRIAAIHYLLEKIGGS